MRFRDDYARWVTLAELPMVAIPVGWARFAGKLYRAFRVTGEYLIVRY